jgi:hypothetical protein
VTLKIKYADFKEMSKRRTLSRPGEDFYTFWNVALDLLAVVEFDMQKKIRLMGLAVSNARETNDMEGRQLKLDFGEDDAEEV